jgi:hypothetical protein
MLPTTTAAYALTALVLVVPWRIARADSVIVNGSFESGSLSGWMSSGFYVNSGTSTPISDLPSVGASDGSFFAVSDSSGPGARYLIQTFSAPTPTSQLTLSFDMFTNNWNGETIVNPIGLDPTDGPNQYARVDILAAGASPLDTGSGVLRNLYTGTDSGFPPNPYTHYSFDVSDLLASGGTYQLRFAEVDTELFLNMGVDNVGLGPAAVDSGITPEPSTLMLLGTGIGVIGLSVCRRRFAPDQNGETVFRPTGPTSTDQQPQPSKKKPYWRALTSG